MNSRHPAFARKSRRLAPLAVPLVLLGLALASIPPSADAQEPEAAPERIPEGKSCKDCHGRLFDKRNVHFAARDDCSACHEQQDEALHRFTYPAQGAALCTECHEKKDLKLEGTVHPPVEKGDCLKCHDPHASNQPRLFKGPPAQVCNACHEPPEGKAPAHLHGPFASGLCQACHAGHASPNEHLLRDAGSALCLRCHEQMVPENEETRWHEAARDNCANCHSGHGTDRKYMLKKRQPDLCLTCHKEIEEQLARLPVKHKALQAENGCAGCHDPHTSAYGRMLRGEGGKLCLGCHDRSYPQAKGRPLADMARKLRENPDHHGPVAELNCEGCHRPHASANYRLLKQAYPKKFYDAFRMENYELCFGCHVKDFIEQERSTITNFRDGDRNLHYLHVHRKKGRTCRACHAVHASNQPHHLRETTPFGDWELPVGFKPLEGGGSCAPGCHVEVTYLREKKAQ